MWSRGQRTRGRAGGRGRNQWTNQRGNRGRGNNRPSFSRDNYKAFKDYGNGEKHKNAELYPMIEKLNEIDIGATEYISDHEGFTGVLKARYSDFHVNEIGVDGVVAKLTDTKVPVDPEPEKEEEDDDVLVKRYRIEQLPIETWDRIHKMIQTKDKDEVIEIDVTEMTKEDRTKIHESVKIVFGQKIVGSTITKDEKKFVTFKLYNKYDKVDRREKWPKSRGGEYLHFLVYKEYTDTIDANIQISESLRMRPSSFCYAGVKDKRAKTTQWFCVRKVDPSRIADRTKYLRNIHVGNFCFKQDTLKLGQLKGNRFRIALRNVTVKNDVIDKAMNCLRDSGFINYYGLQRFGNCKEAPTHEIGILLLQGNWKEAVQLILKPRKHEQDREIGTAKKLYEESGDAAWAYGKLEKKRNRCIEGKLLGGLMKNSANDYVNALENVPRNMRLLYIHAFQSYVWNLIASKRIKEFGLKPMVGDIVVDGNIDEESDQILESAENVTVNIDDEETVEPENESAKQQIKVKILTETDLPNYTIYDIVLPLPGYDITYPGNVVKEWYSELLNQHSLSLDMPKQKVKTYTLSGAYRKIVERVSNLSWNTMGYNDSFSTLIRSDYEELKGEKEPEDIQGARLKALIIDFCLPSSCYATMALREIMKMDTSVETHMQLDNTSNRSSIAIQTGTIVPVTPETTASEIQSQKSIPESEKSVTETTDSEINTLRIKSEKVTDSEIAQSAETESLQIKLGNITTEEPKFETVETVAVKLEQEKNLLTANKQILDLDIAPIFDTVETVPVKLDPEENGAEKRKLESTHDIDPKKIKI